MSAQVECRTFEVDVARLESGTWCHTRDKQIGEGDINASYSADTIGLEGRVRKPFRWMNALWVCTGIHSKAGTQRAEAYRLVPEEHFEGVSATYQQTVTSSEIARKRPEGFYHGMRVEHGSKRYVISGPSAFFVPSKTEQLPLF